MKKLSVKFSAAVPFMLLLGALMLPVQLDAAPRNRRADKEVVTVAEADFDREIARGVVLVDFYADWCPPCRRQAPIAAKAAKRLPQGARIIKVNVDKAKNISRRFNIRAIPTWVVFKDGREVQRFSGLRPEKFLLDVAGQHLRKR